MNHFPKSLLITTLTITTLGVLILGWVMIRDKQPLEVQKTIFTTQQVVSVSWSTETMTTIDPNTCMTTEIPVCKKRFWKDFDNTTCKKVIFEVDCMFYEEVSNNQQEYTQLLSEYGLNWRIEWDIACDAQLLDSVTTYGYACEEKDLWKTIPDTNTKWMCRDNSRTCRKAIRDGKEMFMREKNLGARYDPTGKIEICDGRDNDCDGQTDEWYHQKEYLRDFDGDGWGNIDMKTKACFRPAGHVLKAGDCDDLDKEVYPGAEEICDLKDNNCNRQIDEYLVDCNEEVKECTVMLPLVGNSNTTLWGVWWTANDDQYLSNNHEFILFLKDMVPKERKDLWISLYFHRHYSLWWSQSSFDQQYRDAEEIFNFFHWIKAQLNNWKSSWLTDFDISFYSIWNKKEPIYSVNFSFDNDDDIFDLLYHDDLLEDIIYDNLINKVAIIDKSKPSWNKPIILSEFNMSNSSSRKKFYSKYLAYYDQYEFLETNLPILWNCSIDPFYTVWSYDYFMLSIQKCKDAISEIWLSDISFVYFKELWWIHHYKRIKYWRDEIIKIFNEILWNYNYELRNYPDFLFNINTLPNEEKYDDIKNLANKLFKITRLKIWNKTIELKHPESINLYSWLLRTYLNNRKMYTNGETIFWDEVILEYEKNIKNYIRAWVNFSSSKKLHTFFVRAHSQWWDDINWAVTYNYTGMVSLYQYLWQHWTYKVITSNKLLMTPNQIIDAFAKQIHDYSEDYHLFHLWGHGGRDGSLELAWWNRTVTHFDKLFNLQVAHPWRIRIDIMSCNSFRKDNDWKNNTIGSISLDSSQHVAYWKESWSDSTLMIAFSKKNAQWNLEADYDGDGVVNYHEALIYRAINYNMSLTPIMFDDNGKVIDIVGADILPQNNQDRSNRENDPFVDTQCSMDC
jgi:hypothetical protein